MDKRKVHVAVIAALVGQGGLTLEASAQEGAVAGLEEIVVTATRREVNLQDVPLAVVALTGDNLDMQGIENIEDLNAVVPNVVIAGTNASTNSAQFTMRGIPNVGVYVDGIWQVSNAGLLLRELVELERVEVLRGPQGTLYGRDSTGGAIRLYTRPPAEEFGAEVDVSLGSFDRRDVKASLDLPLTDNFRTRWTVGSYDREGYITSVTTGYKTGNFSDEVIRGDFLWTPSDRVTVRFNAQDDEIVANAPRVQTWIEPQTAWNQGFQVGLAEAFDIASGGRWNCQSAVAGCPGGRLSEWETTSEITVPSRQWLEQQSLDISVDITDTVSFQYLTGHTYVDSRDYNDWDAGEFNFFIDYFNTETELMSHEFQFAGGNDRFTWVGGVYYWDQEGRARNPSWSMREWEEVNDYGQPQPFSYINDILTHPACTDTTPADRGVAFPGVGDPNTVEGWPVPCDGLGGLGWVGALASGAVDRLNASDEDGYAVFGEVVVAVTDRFDVTLGYRFHDQTETNYPLIITPGISAPKPLATNVEWTSGGVYDGIPTGPVEEVSFDADTYRLAGSWRFNDDVMLYAGYTEGFNSGGLSTWEDSLGRLVVPYAPEVIENTEIGVRTDLANGRLRLNATVFQTDWIGIQLPLTVRDRVHGTELTELPTLNAASAEAEGIEVELSYAATDKLLLQANLGFLDTAYVESLSDSVPLDTEFARAPEETMNLGLQYDADVGNGGTLVTRIDASYTGEFWRSDTPTLRQSAYGVPRSFEAGDYWLLNGRLVYTPPGGNYEFALFGTNLLDEYNINSGFMHGIWQFDFGTVDRPREFGISMKMFFN